MAGALRRRLPDPGTSFLRPRAGNAPSSFYKLPKILQWLSANIGYHHIHHLSARIPNYNLKRCHQSHPLFRGVKAVTLFSSFGATRLRLWDERLRKLVGFRHLKELRRRAKGPEKKDSID